MLIEVDNGTLIPTSEVASTAPTWRDMSRQQRRATLEALKQDQRLSGFERHVVDAALTADALGAARASSEARHYKDNRVPVLTGVPRGPCEQHEAIVDELIARAFRQAGA